jgi:hypothetical protein
VFLPVFRARRRHGPIRFSRGSALSTSAVAILGLVLSGCSGSDGGSSPTWSPASPTAARAQAAVLKGYNAYWDAILKASDPPNPDARVLRAHASGVELQRAVEAIKARKIAGQRLSGSYSHAATVTAVSGNTATVADCLTVNVVAKGKKQAGGNAVALAVRPTSVVVLLRNEQQTWKVERIDTGSASCPI